MENATVLAYCKTCKREGLVNPRSKPHCCGTIMSRKRNQKAYSSLKNRGKEMITIRLDKEICDILKSKAAINNQSLNSYCVRRLTNDLDK